MTGRKRAVIIAVILAFGLCLYGGSMAFAEQVSGGEDTAAVSDAASGAADEVRTDGASDEEGSGRDVTLYSVRPDAADAARLKITEVTAGSEYSVRLSGAAAEYTSVRFRIWSEMGGEDDVRSYKAVRQENGSYLYRMKLSAFKHIGNFNVVAIGLDSAGDREEIASAQFETPVPEGGVVSVSSHSYSKGTFKLQMKSLKNSSYMKKVRFLVWSKADQSNKRWYDAEAGRNGVYTASVSIRNHACHAGIYQIEAYATDTSGDARFQSAAEQDMQARFEASVRASGSKAYRVSVGGLKYPGGYSAVYCKVWSLKKGTDDAVWYKASKKNGIYTATVKLSKHKHLGDYCGRIYAVAADGKRRLAGETRFNVAEPYGGTVDTASVKVTKGRFTVRLSGVRYSSRVKKVRFAVWSRDDQSDKRSYTVKKKKDGMYQAVVDLKNHKYSCGIYHIRAYTTDIKGGSQFQGKAEQEMVASSGELTADAPAATPAKRKVTAPGVRAPAGIKKVKFAVWSEDGGKDDLAWYTAKASGTNYSATFNVRDHMSAGLFHVYGYVWSRNGTKKLVAKTTFDAPAAVDGKVKCTEYSKATGAHTGTFNITSAVETEEGQEIADLHYSVYLRASKSDLHVYDAGSADTSYKAKVNVKNHKYHFGTFTIEPYGFMKNGAYFTLPVKTRLMNPNYYVYSKLNSAKDQAAVTMLHSTSSGITSVEFPTWSETGGQDDVVWYTGTQDGSKWTTTVYGISHKDAGKFITDVYLNGNTESNVATTSFTLRWSTGFAGKRLGIDVSKWNGEINWKKVKADGIKYAIIRCGYGVNLKSQDDVRFAYNVAQCEKYGIPYGVYIYSHAKTTQEAYSEAQHCIRLIKGHYPKYPVYLDLEDPTDTAPLSKKRLAAITETWAKKITAAGYKAGVYSSTSWWKTKLTKPVFDKYDKWVAQWAPRVTYTGTFSMWQYSSTGKVKGISGNVDMNYAY